MRTDTIFFQLFQTFDSLLFELVGLPPETASGYRFTSVEIKEKAFRFDGIFMPEALDKNIWFVEVQFQTCVIGKTIYNTTTISKPAAAGQSVRPGIVGGEDNRDSCFAAVDECSKRTGCHPFTH